MVLELEEVMSILDDTNITETEALELATKLEAISQHLVEKLVKEG